MTAIIFNIQRCCVHDGPGIRTTVFFKGCNLRCQWCHNPESFLQAPQLDFGKDYEVDEVFDILLRDKIFYNESGGGITCSGGEPTLQIEFLLELLAKCKEEGIHTCIETNGVIVEADLLRLIPITDLFLVDFKHSDEDKHKYFTGSSNKPVLETLRLLEIYQKAVILRCPIIPQINDTAEHFANIRSVQSNFSCIDKIEIMPYHDIGVSKWEKLSMEYKIKGVNLPKVDDKKMWQEMVVPQKNLEM